MLESVVRNLQLRKGGNYVIIYTNIPVNMSHELFSLIPRPSLSGLPTLV